MPIRVMHVLDNLGRGGLQNGLVNLVKHLDERRFEHVICVMRPLHHADAHVFPDKVRTMCVDHRIGRRVQIPQLVSAIRRVRPNVVHSRNWSAIEAVLAGRYVGGCSLIHSEHGLDSTAVQPLRRRMFRRVCFNLADSVVTVSHQLKDFHAETAGFPADRITVIHNGVDLQKFRPDAEARNRARQALGLTTDDFCIGSIGNLTLVKDHLTLLKAAALFGRTRSNWRLIIAGEGNQLQHLTTFVASAPELQGKVFLPGLTSRVPELLNAMDVFVLSSLTEGVCNSLLEAMATALPVIVTATGGNPETVSFGQCGLLFAVGDFEGLAKNMELLASDKERRNAMGRRALQGVCQDHALDSMMQRYTALYETFGAVSHTRSRGQGHLHVWNLRRF